MSANKQEKPQVRITLVRSLIGRTEKQRAIVKGLGLRRMHQQVIREKTPEILGMIAKIPFMLNVEEVSDGQSK